MRTRNLLEVMMLAFAIAVFAAGPVSAETAEEIIAEFCAESAKLAGDSVDELENARDDIRECRREFSDCRGGDFIGDDDPVIQCLSNGLTCLSRGFEDRADACNEHGREFEDAYNDALSEARRSDVEDQVQLFFNTDSAERDECLIESAAVGVLCSLPEALLE
jgi:hypothetical protein